MNVQPWAMYTPQAYQPYPLAGILGGFAPGTGGGQLAPQGFVGNLLSGLAGLTGQGLGGQFGYPPVGQFGYPPVGHVLGSLGSLLPFHAAPGMIPGMIPGVWGGPQAGQFPLQGLFGTPFGQGVGLTGQGLGGQVGYPQIGPFGYPQIGQGQGLGGLLPFMAQGAWSGQPPYIGGQWAPYGLNLLSGLAGHAGQHIGGLPPFQTTPGIATVA